MFCAKCGKEVPVGATFCPNCGASVQASAAGAPVSGIDLITKDQRAQRHWFERLIAFVIDAIIVNVALFIVVLIIVIPFMLVSPFNPFDVVFGSRSWFSGLVLVLYFAFMESGSGASFGKRIFRLKVVNRSGSNPTFAEAFVRNLSKINVLLLILDVIIGLAVSKGYTQKYSDIFMGTTVVRS